MEKYYSLFLTTKNAVIWVQTKMLIKEIKCKGELWIGCSPSFVPRSVVQPSLGPGRRLSSMGINRLLVLWLLTGGLQGDTQRRWDRWRRDRLLSSISVLWSEEVYHPPFPDSASPPHGPKGFGNTGLPAAISGLGWSSLPLLLTPGQFTFPGWCLKPCS